MDSIQASLVMQDRNVNMPKQPTYEILEVDEDGNLVNDKWALSLGVQSPASTRYQTHPKQFPTQREHTESKLPLSPFTHSDM